MSKWRPKRRSTNVLLFLAAATVTSVFFIDVCNLIFECGCRSLWAGADAHCNIHQAHVRHCPFCSIGLAGSIGVWGAILAAQAAVMFLPRDGGALRRLAAGVVTFPVVAGVFGLVLGLSFGYWE